MSESVVTVFEDLNVTFKAQDAIRETIRAARDEAYVHVRAAQGALSRLHTAKDLSAEAESVRALLKATGKPLRNIELELPPVPGSFHRYADIWHGQLHISCMVAVVLEFIESGSLADMERVKKMISADITLPVEDYLVGVCNAVAELARLSLNRVIGRDYDMPRKCHKFASNVFEGFKELNLRNDFLRKRYDGMKYDVKKIEDILYDLSIRGMEGKKRKSTGDELKTRKKVKTNGEGAADDGAADDGAADDGAADDGAVREDEAMDGTAKEAPQDTTAE